ncbi:MFS transporter [Ewingella americana]|uniref:MFS transporter n=1 Tax=Ewingella americana TaxID=41202 RepID=UPI00191E6C4E|nr:MFS transporter [Ewingella americana]
MLLGIVSGPAIGGWLADDFGWPSLFLTSIPLVAFIALVMSLDLTEKKATQPGRFDFFGFISFTAAIIGLQMVLDRGERLEWWDSPEIWLEAAMSLLAFMLFIAHVLTSPSHFLSKALFRDRNFVLCTLLFFAAGFVLLPTMALTSPMLDELLGYPPMTTGLLTLPRGIGIVGGFVLMSRAPRGLTVGWRSRREPPR